jgi:hypothetical protein
MEADLINVLENSLRDLIEQVLRSRHGSTWLDHLGVTPDRMAEWERRRDEERKKRTAGAIDERLLYYADFTDLFAVIRKNWDPDFKACFGDQTELRVYMEKLGAFRNPRAHSRPLLPVEQQLIAGMTGELRQKITLFVSKGGGGPERECFARIEEVIDSFGNRATGQASGGGSCETGLTLRPGDIVILRGQAWDPEDSSLQWSLFFAASKRFVEIDGVAIEYEWLVSEDDISETSYIGFTLSSERPYRRYVQHNGDAHVNLFYRVLPR